MAIYEVKTPQHLMDKFQRYLKEGMGVPQALRRVLKEEGMWKPEYGNGSDGIPESAKEVRAKKEKAG